MYSVGMYLIYTEYSVGEKKERCARFILLYDRRGVWGHAREWVKSR